MFLENQSVDDRISRAIDNDHTAAMKAPTDNRKHMKKKSKEFYLGNREKYIVAVVLSSSPLKKSHANDRYVV